MNKYNKDWRPNEQTRYKWNGDILTGIVQYIQLYKHVNKEENR